MMLNRWDFRGRGVGIGWSPDGIYWEFTSYVNRLGGFDTHNLFFWDDRIGRYTGYFRTHVRGKRSIGRATSPDAFHWSAPVTVHTLDEQDPPAWQIYGPGIFKYSRARDVYVMYGEGYDSENEIFRGQLGLSRDGIHWKRFRDGYFADTSAGTWDAGSVRPIPAEAVVDGRMAVFYTGSDHSLHDWEGTRGVGLATYQQGAFAGWRAASEGTLTTRLLLAKDREPGLLLNAEAEGGEIRAELLDVRGNPIPGYTREECRPLTGNGHQQEVVWEGQERPGSGGGAGRLQCPDVFEAGYDLWVPGDSAPERPGAVLRRVGGATFQSPIGSASFGRRVFFGAVVLREGRRLKDAAPIGGETPPLLSA